MIARLLYDKGYHEYVEAAQKIKKEFPDVQFRLLGAFAESSPNHVPKSIVARDCSNGYINYLGFSSNVIPIIQEADCIVLPSFYLEGLSRTLMEGLAMGKPIITTDIPGCRETVDDGVNGFLVKPKDVNSLVSVIERFLELPQEQRHEMGRRSRQKAEKEFDVKEVIAIYKQITSPWVAPKTNNLIFPNVF